MSAPARADAITDFYKGKDLRLIISSSVGGGYDIYRATYCLPSQQAHPRKSNHRSAEYAGCGRHRGGEFILQHRAKGWVGHCRHPEHNTVRTLFREQGRIVRCHKLNWLGTPTTEVAILSSAIQDHTADSDPDRLSRAAGRR